MNCLQDGANNTITDKNEDHILGLVFNLLPQRHTQAHTCTYTVIKIKHKYKMSMCDVHLPFQANRKQLLWTINNDFIFPALSTYNKSRAQLVYRAQNRHTALTCYPT